MTGAEDLALASEAGVQLRVEGDRLLARPASKVSPTLRAALEGSRAEVLAALRYPCVFCGVPLDESTIACPACVKERRDRRRLATEGVRP